MKIAVASGKGGTGKTTVSAALTAVWARPLMAVDLDVEAPNLHLFLKPDIIGRSEAFVETPVFDASRCDYCGKCADLCQFKAISVFGEILMTFPEMCHGCGGCLDICPNGALSPGKRPLGEILHGTAGEAAFIMGRLRIGEAMSPPLMRLIKTEIDRRVSREEMDVIIDAPPGVSCPAVNAVMGCDMVVLVTEPTPFGLYDLKLAIEAFTPLGMPLGVVVNRMGIGNDAVLDHCRETGVPILAQIPCERRIAEDYARGKNIIHSSDHLQALFSLLKEQIIASADSGKRGSPHV